MVAPWTLDGRRVFITGGARGIGLETARALAARGAKVALVDLEPDVLEAAAATVAGAQWFAADVTDQAALQTAVDGTVEAFGGIDIVLASAGIAPVGSLRDMDPEAFERTIDVNVLGVFRTIRTTLPHVIDTRGYILSIASLAAVSHAPMMGPYSASKAAVEALCNVLRIEVAHLGVDVGCAYFSFLDTPMVRGGRQNPLFENVTEMAPGFVSRIYPVRIGVDAIVHGMEHRSRLVYAPRFVRAAIALRSLLQRISERDMLKAMPAIDASFRADIAKRGADEASRPVGPGGAAATQRQSHRTR